ncbi:MAG: NADH-quinone oxidoreductase subunit N [Bacteroidales bacterium]|nr:NADH-quinone oxidoreductase subunit N [Bacteroidales bacterium]
MDYSQFLYMSEELSLLAVIVIIFLADLFLCGKDEKGIACTTEGGECPACGCNFRTVFPVVLMLIHTVLNLLPCCGECCMGTAAFGGMYVHTPMMTIVKSVLNIGVIVVFLMASQWLNRPENRIKMGEFHSVVLFTLLGMYFMISSGHFIMFFIGLELASIPMTALVAYDKKQYESAEAGAKFILLALFSSALLLYGISLIYGVTGTLYLDEIGARLDVNLLSVLGLVLFISGMGFKISLVPFHLWTADTYQGAPTVVTGYLSVISKGSAAFVLMTVLMKVFGSAAFEGLWSVGFFWIIIVSITIANLFAIRQKNLKRFMAFSAISQAGYLILGIMGGTAQGMTSLVFYLFVYMAANLGAFAVLNVVEQNSGKIGMDDYDGLYQTNPKLAFLMTLCLFSLAGIPPFAGFFSKFFVFMAAFNAGYHLLVFIALVNTVISLYYYLLIVKAMYIKQSETPIPTFKSDCGTRAALTICIIGVVLLGIASVVYNYIDCFSYGLI